MAAGEVDPNTPLEKDLPPLYLAIEHRDCETAEVLIANGADVEGALYGWTPLQQAAQTGASECAELLLRHGADPDRNVRGAPPLHLAAKQGDARTIRALLAHEARVDVAFAGWYPLQIAASYGHADAVEALLEGGADPNTQNRARQNPLHMAASRGHEEAAEALLKHGSRLTEITSDPWTTARTFAWAAGYAAQRGNPARAEHLHDIACEYYPVAVDVLRKQEADEHDLAEAEERSRECEERAGEGGIRRPLWEAIQTPQPL